MIRDAEIRRLAGQAGVEPRIVELDYALGWALRGLAGHPYLAERLIFKGGTCLRKCYFPDYRFSEDVDFTATRWFGWEEFEEAVSEAFAEAQAASGIDFGARDPKLKVIDDDYGRESLNLTIYWRGPHAGGGSPAGLRLDITRNEVVVFDPALRIVGHPFSDADDLGEVRLPCYSLDEIMAEKVRAVLGQRVYAISRDIYDIFSLMEEVDERQVLAGLPRKMAAREMDAGFRRPPGVSPPGFAAFGDTVWTQPAAKASAPPLNPPRENVLDRLLVPMLRYLGTYLLLPRYRDTRHARSPRPGRARSQGACSLP